MKQVLAGKVAVITGSGEGIGRGIALYFAKCGAKVVTNNRHSHHHDKADSHLSAAENKKYLSMMGDAEGTAKEIQSNGGEAVPCYADVTDPAAAKKLIQCAIDHFGRIDILVNNAATLGQGTVDNTKKADWDRLTQSKMTGAFNTMHKAIPIMQQQGAGTILNSASNAWTGIANLAAYSAANAGLVGLSKASAKELAKTGITVNAYCPQAMSPGHLREFNKTIDSLKKQFGAAAQPSKEKMAQINKAHGDPQRLAPFLAYLCTPEGHHYSGDVFSITTSGEIGYFSESQISNKIQKDDAPWTIDELQKAIPQQLLSHYLPLAERDNWNNNQGADKGLQNGVIFNRGKEIQGFAGEGPDYVNLFMGPQHPSKCSVGNVTMAPGTHSNWHRHFGYQLLLVTGGHGYYQEEGQPVQTLSAGDVVEVKPGVKHWHGADHQHWFTCIGMILNADKPTEDAGAVQDYDQLK